MSIPKWKEMGDDNSSLIFKVRASDAAGLDYIEVDAKVIEGLTGTKANFMTYMNKKVYAYGTKDKVEKQRSMTQDDALFGHSTAPIDFNSPANSPGATR